MKSSLGISNFLEEISSLSQPGKPLMEYYSAIKGMSTGTTEMNLENVILGKRSQIQKAAYCIVQSCPTLHVV